MKKQYTTALLTAGLLLLSGCASKDSSSSDNAAEISTSTSAEYKSGTFTTYQLTNFSFTISDDFTDKYGTADNVKVPKKMTFDNELFDTLNIEGYRSVYEDIAYYGEAESENLKSLGNSEVNYELIDLDGFQAAVIDYIEKWEGEDKIWSSYTVICEGRGFNIFAMYPVENKDKVVPMLDDIIRSAVYTSDYRLPTGQQEYETELYSISFGPEWVRNDYRSESAMEQVGLVCSDSFCFAKAATDDEAFCTITIEAGDAPEANSAVSQADATKDTILERDSSLLFNAERSQREMLGETAETVSYNMGSDDDTLVNVDHHFFEHNGKLFQIKIMYKNSGQQEEILRKFNELIGNITLK